MKNLCLTAVTAISLACATARAALPTFKTLSQTNTTQAFVIFPQDPNSQIRLVNVIASSDLASSKLTVLNGTTARYVTVTNVAASTSLTLDATNGLTAGCALYVQGAGSNVIAQVSTINNSTNVTLTGNLGIPVGLNYEVEVMTTNVPSLLIGGNTNKTFSSDGLFVGNYGRALELFVNGTAACSIDTATVHYDSTGN